MNWICLRCRGILTGAAVFSPPQYQQRAGIWARDGPIFGRDTNCISPPPPPPEPVHSSFLRWFKAQKLPCRLAGGRAEYRDASALPAEVQGPRRDIGQSFDVQLTFKKEKRRETLSCPPPPPPGERLQVPGLARFEPRRFHLSS